MNSFTKKRSIEIKLGELEGEVRSLKKMCEVSYWDENKPTPFGGGFREFPVSLAVNSIMEHFGLEFKYKCAQPESAEIVTREKEGK